jgi:diadenosine tetraphosphate (Ap4A) HIT family hydrolase
MTQLAACPLCAAAHEAAIWRNHKLRVVAVADPDYPGFTRVIWQDHVREMTDLPEADRAYVMAVVLEVEAVQRAVLAPHKVNLASFGNMVPHVHWHVIPRWQGDRHFPDPSWAAARVAPGTESAEFLARQKQVGDRLALYHERLRQQLSARFPG